MSMTQITGKQILVRGHMEIHRKDSNVIKKYFDFFIYKCKDQQKLTINYNCKYLLVNYGKTSDG